MGRRKNSHLTSTPTQTAPVYPSPGVSCPHWLPQGLHAHSPPQELVSRVSVPIIDKGSEVILQQLSGESGGIWGQPGEAAEGVQTTHVYSGTQGNWELEFQSPFSASLLFSKRNMYLFIFGTLCCGPLASLVAARMFSCPKVYGILGPHLGIEPESTALEGRV